MTLQYDVNQTPTSGSSAIVQLVTVLSSANWTVHAYGDGSSRVGTGALPTATQMSNSSSWIAMKAPSGNHTITFQRGTNNTLWWLAYTFGGLQTDGNGLIVDSPVTASDRKDFFNNGSDTVPGVLFPADNVSGSFRFNVVASDTTPYNWHANAWNITTGESRTLIYFEGLTVHTNDPARYVVFAEYRTSSPWAGMRELMSHSTSTRGRTWHAKGLGAATWTKAVPLCYIAVDGVYPFPRQLSANPFDGNDDLAPPVYITTYSGGYYYFKGVGTLFMWSGISRATGDTFDIVGETDDRVCIGDTAFPWPHGIPALV